MTPNQIATYSAIGLAAVAVIYLTRKPAKGVVSTQPGQQQRSAGLADWLNSTAESWGYLGGGAMPLSAGYSVQTLPASLSQTMLNRPDGYK